jgi:predicted AAA+ superfamily ATPase
MARSKRRPTARKAAERLGTLLAEADGKVLNASALARSIRSTDGRVRRMLVALALAGVVRLLPAWRQRLRKRQVKAPIVWVRGASWHARCLERIQQSLRAKNEACFFWSTYQGAKLDLLVVQAKRRRGYALTRSKNPTLTKALRIAMDDLKLTSLDLIHTGKRTRRIAPRVRAVAAGRILRDIRR